MFRDLLRADLKLIIRKPVLLSITLVPVILGLIVKLCYSLIPDLIISGHRLQPENYLTLILITIVSSVPIVVGIILATIHRDDNENKEPFSNTQKKEILKTLPVRMSYVLLLSFLLVLLGVVLTDPVPSEGWLRTVYIAGILALLSPLIYFLIVNRRYYRGNLSVIFFLSCLLLAAVPAGLLLGSPWNISAFISPVYWISWAWVTSSRIESIFCGALSVIMMLVPILILYRIILIHK